MLDPTEYSLQLGFFPAPFQIFEITITENPPGLSAGAAWYNFGDIGKIPEGIHPLLSEIIKPFVKDSTTLHLIYQKGQETVGEIIRKKNYRQDMQRFYEERVKKSLR